MAARSPAVAGQFYPADTGECREQVEAYLASATASLPADAATSTSTSTSASAAVRGGGTGATSFVAGIMPHAGWVCSGAVAAYVAAAARAVEVDTFVVFGATHRVMSARAAIWHSGPWQTPLGAVAIDRELAEAVLEASPLVTDDESAHVHEHSIEVEVPFLQVVHPEARLLPVLVMPVSGAVRVGQVVAEQARALGRKVVFLGSSDLTHYGPRYGFTPEGIGLKALRWAKEVNDRRMLDLCLRLEADQVVGEAARHYNACGSGAMAATLAAARHCGATAGTLRCHTTSAEVLREQFGEVEDAVGYAAVVFNSPAA